MTTTIWTIKGAFGLIGESVRESIEEAIRTYRQEVERMNEKVEKLERAYMYVFVKEKTR